MLRLTVVSALVAIGLVIGFAATMPSFADCCSNTATTEVDASCSGEQYTHCDGMTCSFTIQCPPLIRVDCEEEGYYCLVSYWITAPHENCDQTGQENLECYQDGEYTREFWWKGGCKLFGGCKTLEEDVSKREYKDDYNTRPCS